VRYETEAAFGGADDITFRTRNAFQRSSRLIDTIIGPLALALEDQALSVMLDFVDPIRPGGSLVPRVGRGKARPELARPPNFASPRLSLRVVFCLREGAVLLEVSNAGRRLELYREDVHLGQRDE